MDKKLPETVSPFVIKQSCMIERSSPISKMSQPTSFGSNNYISGGVGQLGGIGGLSKDSL